MKRRWQREDYRARLTKHLNIISPKGVQKFKELRASGALTISDETRRRYSEGQRRRFGRPEERKKLEEARKLSFQVIDFQERAKLMHNAFLAKYGSFVDLAKMGLGAPNRKPNKLELEAAKLLGEDWQYVGQGKLGDRWVDSRFCSQDEKGGS